LCRRRRAGQFLSAAKKSAAALLGAALEAKKCFLKIPEKMSFYLQKLLMTFFSHRKLQQNKYAATIGIGGAPISYRRRRADQQKSASSGARLFYM